MKRTPLPQVHSHSSHEVGADIIMALDAELSERFRLEKLSHESVPTDFQRDTHEANSIHHREEEQ